MADVKVVHLCSIHVDTNCELRFVNVGPSSGLKTTLPLLLGSDLLSEAKVIQTNHCRIHARYGKKGMATKLYFPSDVSIGGISNCQSGAWFYTVQGAFQVVFEYHSRPKQLKIVAALVDLWKSEAAVSDDLPEKLQLSIEQLFGLDSGVSSDPSHLSHLLAQCDLLESSVASPDETLAIISDNRLIEDDEPEEPGMPERQLPDAASSDSLSCLCDELVCRVRSFMNKCGHDQRQLSLSLVSFLKLVKSASAKSDGIENGIFMSFAQLVTHYSTLLGDQSRLRSFGADASWTGVFDAPQHALLCLVGEWLGKHLNRFSDAVTKKVELFKMRSLLVNLPPASELIGELFPECMRLLIGFWIGLYGAPETMPSTKKVGITTSSSRDDHSYYSSHLCDVVMSKSASNRADHSYSSAPASPSETPQLPPTIPPRKDHTYVAPSPKLDTPESLPVSGTREDHTYVSTKDRGKLKTPPPPDPVEVGLPNAKRFKVEAVPNAVCTVVQPSKYPFILLILEFLNDTLVSGVAHVVYTRLLTHPVNNNYY